MASRSLITGTVVLLVLCWACMAASLPTREPVESLPGFGPPPTRHFSGFVEVEPASGTYLFYYLVESQDSPETDPLLWWMNGGPGSSSFWGLFAENGPLLLNETGSLLPNPLSWNKHANMLFVEFGPGIGFSFCANSSRPESSCHIANSTCSPCAATDSTIVDQNVALIEALLAGSEAAPALFPELKGRPLYITGESYAGVYVPTLAEAIIERHNDTSAINLQGLWVTDPCTDNDAQYGWLDIGIEFAYQKGMIANATYRVLKSEACTTGFTRIGDRNRNTDTIACRHAWRIYDLATAGVGEAQHSQVIPGLPMYIDPLNAYGPTGGADVEGYLRRADVQKAIHADGSPNALTYHVGLGNNGYDGYTSLYAACNNNPQTERSMVDVYRDIVKSAAMGKPAAANLHTIILSTGDIDPVVALHGTEAAADKLGFPIADGGERRPWFYNSTRVDADTLIYKPVPWGQSLASKDAGVQVGGFTKNYATAAKNLSLSLVTVRDSGHMVPAYAPRRAAHVIVSALMHRRPLAPLLPHGWDSMTDEEFYGLDKPQGGAFTGWVVDAMSNEYVGEADEQ